MGRILPPRCVPFVYRSGPLLLRQMRWVQLLQGMILLCPNRLMARSLLSPSENVWFKSCLGWKDNESVFDKGVLRHSPNVRRERSSMLSPTVGEQAVLHWRNGSLTAKERFWQILCRFRLMVRTMLSPSVDVWFKSSKRCLELVWQKLGFTTQ